MADFELQQIDSLLLTLQDVLRDKFALESEIEALPLNLSTQKEELAEANRKYLELNEKYNKAKEEAAKYAVDYDEAFQERTNAEKMMDSITTQREYEALSKQIEEAKVRENGLLRARNNSNSLVIRSIANISSRHINKVFIAHNSLKLRVNSFNSLCV